MKDKLISRVKGALEQVELQLVEATETDDAGNETPRRYVQQRNFNYQFVDVDAESLERLRGEDFLIRDWLKRHGF